MTDPLKDIQEMMKPVTELSDNLMKSIEEQLQPMKSQIQPALDMAEINKKAAEKLISLQSDYVTDFVNSSLAQFKALLDTKDPKEALHLQIEFFKTVDAKFTEVAEKELAALSEAKDQLADVVETSLTEFADAPFMKDLKGFDFSQFDVFKVMAANAEKAGKATPARKAAPAAKPAAAAAAKAEAAPAAKAPADKPASK